MSDKNVHYKLDFKIKREGKRNLTFKDFRRRYYWMGSHKWEVPFVEDALRVCFDANKLMSVVPNNIDVPMAAFEAGIALNRDETIDFLQFVKLGRAVWYKGISDETGRLKNRNITSGSQKRYEAIVAYLYTKTPEYQDCEKQFQTWLAGRPGLREVWDEVYEDQQPDLIGFARAVNNGEFRTKLENARPRTLKIGTLVQLKDRFINNRSKDPFYWNEEYKGSPRLGMIAGFNENSAFGYGSRLLRIMWIANSEESTLMERELKILSE